ncbi:MAG: hypothetical protein ABI175_16725, partial [Polyangiales bacterium]
MKRGVDARLVQHLVAARARAKDAAPAAEVIARSVEDLVHRGGKRFRPALLAAAWLACDGARSSGPGDDASLPVGLPSAVLDAGCA